VEKADGKYDIILGDEKAAAARGKKMTIDSTATRRLDPIIWKWLRALGIILGYTAVFSIAYAQAPLFTSNQNQYFLHGMAQAGVGDLRADWLANTLDPTPVFSLFVQWTIQTFHSYWIFYVAYAVLIGVYAWSLVAILDTIFPLGSAKRRWIVALGALVLIHSAAIRFGLSSVLGADWSYLLEDGLAGQRALGTVFQPSVFAAFLILSVALFLRKKPWAAALSAAVAATVHPTYLLGAAVLVAAYMASLWREDRSLRRPILLGLFSLAAVAPILIYAYGSFLQSDFTIAHQARVILVYARVPHHALISVWFGWPDAVKVTAIFFAIYLVRRGPLFWILGIPMAAGVALTLAQMISTSVLLALIFPWRISVYLFPIAVTVILAAGLTVVWPRLGASAVRILAGVSILLSALAMVAGVGRFAFDTAKLNAQPESALMRYVAAHPQPGAVYMVPPKMQNFRLATGAAIYVDKESIPYRDIDVIEWNRRLELASGIYKDLTCPALERMHRMEGITNVVVEQDNVPQLKGCDPLERIYADDAYVLYEIRGE
jgi:hypothetical protein